MIMWPPYLGISSAIAALDKSTHVSGGDRAVPLLEDVEQLWRAGEKLSLKMHGNAMTATHDAPTCLPTFSTMPLHTSLG